MSMDIFRFNGLHSCLSHCGVEIHTHNGRNVVILTELPDNPGTSVTNFVENIANLLRVQRPELNRTNTIWIEHYPAGTVDESFDHVDFVIDQHGQFRSPDWHHLTKKQVDALIGK